MAAAAQRKTPVLGINILLRMLEIFMFGVFGITTLGSLVDFAVVRFPLLSGYAGVEFLLGIYLLWQWYRMPAHVLEHTDEQNRLNRSRKNIALFDAVQQIVKSVLVGGVVVLMLIHPLTAVPLVAKALFVAIGGLSVLVAVGRGLYHRERVRYFDGITWNKLLPERQGLITLHQNTRDAQFMMAGLGAISTGAIGMILFFDTPSRHIGPLFFEPSHLVGALIAILVAVTVISVLVIKSRTEHPPAQPAFKVEQGAIAGPPAAAPKAPDDFLSNAAGRSLKAGQRSRFRRSSLVDAVAPSEGSYDGVGGNPEIAGAPAAAARPVRRDSPPLVSGEKGAGSEGENQGPRR